MKVFVLNGPNLNLLGEREPAIYGTTTLDDVRSMCESEADELGLEIDFRQTNDEATLIDWIQEGRAAAQAIVINPAAFTHYSLALADALQASELPVVEVHISNIFAREPWRAKSVVTPSAKGIISGFGVGGYRLALRAAAQLLKEGNS